MSHRAGKATVFILGIAMVPCAQTDVLNYARDWTQREEKINPSRNRRHRERNVLYRIQSQKCSGLGLLKISLIPDYPLRLKPKRFRLTTGRLK